MSPVTWVTFVLLAAVLVVVVVIPVPAMIDYVNHLARMELLAGPADHPAYVRDWRLVPNLAMDLIVPAAARVMPVVLATRLFLVVTLALLVTGAMAVERAVTGRHRFAGLCALAVLFSLPIAWGLVNFSFGLGLALWGVAGWIGSAGRPLWQRWVLHALVCVSLFVAHFLALGFYGIVVGLVAFAPLLAGRMRWREAAMLVLVLASPVVVLLGIMVATGGTIGGSAIDWDFALKLRWPLMVMNVYSPLVARSLLVVLLVLLAWLVVRRGARLTPTGRVVAGGLLLLYLALPRQIFDVAYLDVRVLLLMALVLPAFVTLRPAPVAAAVLVAVALVNAAVSLAAWRVHQQDYAEFATSFERLPPATAVLIAAGAVNGAFDPPLYYAATRAVPARGVFVASFYAMPGAQPVVPAPAFADLAPRRGLDHVPVPLANLDTPLAPVHVQNWRCRFDFIYVLGRPMPPLRGLQPVAQGRRFVLHRIVPPPGCRQ
jgi:hypothetical protein